MKKLITVVLLATLLNSCKATDTTITKYTIKQGEHKSVFSMDLCSNVLEYDVMFDESAMYDLKSVDQYDINKLFGFNSCNSLHHSNSARFGWTYVTGDSIEIYAYIYENSIRYFQKIYTVKIDDWNSYKLTDNYFAYVFEVNSFTYIYTKTQDCTTNYHYKLYPYFGGNQVAPHDITIYFREK